MWPGACSNTGAPSTTNRYVHLDDATLSQASERIATAIERKLRPSNGKVRGAVISSGVSGTAVWQD